MPAGRATPPTALRRCPSDDHDHGRRLPAVDRPDGPALTGGGPLSRSRDELAAVLEELDRRRCAGGPLVLREDGVADRLEPDGWIGGVLAHLPEATPDDGSHDAPLDEVLRAMGIETVEDLRSLRRLTAVHAALAALSWAAAPPDDAPAAAGDLLQELDDPSRAWA